ncbi:MAG: zinc ribbon domain-containing protein [Oscillospiraceae bacterium]|nr:zinc ribbon domain-containing protein [Oscillospiraceae bacterium]
MPYCTMCGEKLRDGAAFCTACGAPVAPAEASVFPETAAPAAGAPIETTAAVTDAPADAAADAAASAADAAASATGATASAAGAAAAASDPGSAPAVLPPATQPAQPGAAGTWPPVTQPAASAAAPSYPTLAPSAKAGDSSKRTAITVVILIFAAIAVVVGLVTLLLANAFSGGAASGATDAQQMQSTVESYLSAVVGADPAKAWSYCYEFSDSSDEDIKAYVENDREEYGYATDLAQSSSDLDLFVWWYSPDSLDLTGGVKSAQLTAFDASVPSDYADGDYVRCNASLLLNTEELKDYETSLYFSMARYNEKWYIVYYDADIAYSGGGSAELTAEDAEFMLRGMLEEASVSDSYTDILYYIHSTISLPADQKTSLADSWCMNKGIPSAQFGLAAATQILRDHGLEAQADAQSLALTSFSLADIPSDYAEGDRVPAQADITAAFADGTTVSQSYSLDLIYENGYWTVDYTF